MILTEQNKSELMDLIIGLFPKCNVTKMRIENKVFDKFIGKELVVEDSLWYFKN